MLAGPSCADALGGNCAMMAGGGLLAGITVTGCWYGLASYVRKKCMRSWRMGPPKAMPYSLVSDSVLVSVSRSAGVRARQLSAEYVPKACPPNSLVPERDSAVMAALEIWSNSAL